jgi:small neutral amino acid transporter SnatA (MarC family)
MPGRLAESLVTLIVVLDPIGSVPILAALSVQQMLDGVSEAFVRAS